MHRTPSRPETHAWLQGGPNSIRIKNEYADFNFNRTGTVMLI